ncbi:hypothetical protein [Frankia sp. EI5c]|uniref:hypothetical protein n=1 Tax=Frankia sp. EI5c TaxID=683316 RepID=UPI0018FE47AC|nr:hypothetical protein [Frankia sp. EI5c]
MVGDISLSSADPAAVEARGLAPEAVAAVLPTMRWLKLVTEQDGVLTATDLGAAVFHRARQEDAEARLSAVVSFADVLEAAVGSERATRSAPRALRQLAQGVISRDQAVRLLLA